MDERGAVQPPARFLRGQELIDEVRRVGHLGPWRAGARHAGMDFAEYANRRLRGLRRCVYRKHWVKEVNAAKMCRECAAERSKEYYHRDAETSARKARLRARRAKGLHLSALSLRCEGCGGEEVAELVWRDGKRRAMETRAARRFAVRHWQCVLRERETTTGAARSAPAPGGR